MGTTGLEPGTSSVSWKRSNQLSYAPVAGRTLAVVTAPTHLPLVDVAALVEGRGDVEPVAREIDQACRDIGFFRITGHGVDPDLLGRIDALARQFFAQPDDVKQAIAMPTAGSAWRGWFPVGGELTSGRPDRKEGLYIGADHPATHPRVVAGVPLHGPNLFPDEPAGPRPRGPRVAGPARACRGRRHARHRDRARTRTHLVRGEPDRRSDGAVPDLPLSTGRRLGLGCRRAHRLRVADAARPGRPRRPAGARPRRMDRRARRARCARVQHRRHARPPDRGPVSLDAAPRQEPERTEPTVVPVLLRPVVGRRGRAPAARRVATR